MIFGLVPASTLQAVELHLAEMQQLNADLRQRHADLLAKYHDVVSKPAPAPMAQKTADPIMEAIGTMAGTNGWLRKQLGQYAKDARQGKIPDEEIVHSILNWRDVDEDAA